MLAVDGVDENKCLTFCFLPIIAALMQSWDFLTCDVTLGIQRCSASCTNYCLGWKSDQNIAKNDVFQVCIFWDLNPVSWQLIFDCFVEFGNFRLCRQASCSLSQLSALLDNGQADKGILRNAKCEWVLKTHDITVIDNEVQLLTFWRRTQIVLCR